MAKSFVTVGFLAVGVTAVTLLIIGHPHRQAQESRATPDAAKLAAAHSGPATGNAAALLPSPPADWTVPNVDTLRDEEWGRTVRYGRDLITKTYALIGPEVADDRQPAPGRHFSLHGAHPPGQRIVNRALRLSLADICQPAHGGGERVPRGACPIWVQFETYG
jgi:hypothetical protein